MFGAFVVVVVLLVIETRLSVDGGFVKGGEPVPVSKEGGFGVHSGKNKGRRCFDFHRFGAAHQALEG